EIEVAVFRVCQLETQVGRVGAELVSLLGLLRSLCINDRVRRSVLDVIAGGRCRGRWSPIARRLGRFGERNAGYCELAAATVQNPYPVIVVSPGLAQQAGRRSRGPDHQHARRSRRGTVLALVGLRGAGDRSCSYSFARQLLLRGDGLRRDRELNQGVDTGSNQQIQ